MTDHSEFANSNSFSSNDNNLSEHIIIDKASLDMSDSQLLSFYSDRYRNIDVAHFLKTERKERFYGLINLIQAGEYYLDIGCANGGHMDELARRGNIGVGMDISIPNIIKGREKNPTLKFIHGFAEEIPFSDNYFDVVILGDVLEHFREPLQVLYESLRVSKKAVVLCVPVDDKKTDEHISPFSLDSLEKILKFFKLDYHYFSPSGVEISRFDVQKNLQNFCWALVRAEITDETKKDLSDFFQEKNRIKQPNNYAVIERKLNESNSNIPPSDNEVSHLSHLISHLIEGNSVLNIECCHGNILSELIKHKLKVVDIKVSSKRIIEENCKNFQNLNGKDFNFCIMDLSTTAFKDNSFDTVIICDILEFIRSSRSIIQESYRIIRNGGRIIISVPDGSHTAHDGYLRCFFKDTLETELRQYSENIEWHDLSFKKWLICSFFVIKKNFTKINGPSIDILMPTYNGRKTIRRAIESVVAQTYENWNLVVINDGGEDISDIIADIKDPRINYFISEHKGKSHALNIGLEKSRSEYISYLDDDDIIYPIHLEVLITEILKNNHGFVYSDWYEVEINEDNFENNRCIYQCIDVTPMMLLLDSYINHKCIVHKREYLSIAGMYDEDLQALIDWDMIRRLAFVESPRHIRSFTSEHFLYFSFGRNKNRISNIFYNSPQKGEEIYLNILRKSNKQLSHLDKSVIISEFIELLIINRNNKFQINNLNSQINNLNSQINNLNSQINNLNSQINNLNSQINNLLEKNHNITNEFYQIKRVYNEHINKFFLLMQIPFFRWFSQKYERIFTYLQIKMESKIIQNSSFFDPRWYLTNYPDVKLLNMDPVEHYSRYGWHEMRDPSPNFSTKNYLINNPDVLEAGINPLVHFITYGLSEKRKVSGNFKY